MCVYRVPGLLAALAEEAAAAKAAQPDMPDIPVQLVEHRPAPGLPGTQEPAALVP